MHINQSRWGTIQHIPLGVWFIGRLEAEFTPATLLVEVMDEVHFTGQISDGAIAVRMAQVAGPWRSRRGIHQQMMGLRRDGVIHEVSR